MQFNPDEKQIKMRFDDFKYSTTDRNTAIVVIDFVYIKIALHDKGVNTKGKGIIYDDL